MQNTSFTDQLQRQVTVLHPPRRIISLVPSQTELLFHLGLDREVVGITKFCVHPQKQFKCKTKIGGTKTLNLERIRSLQPDLIIGNKEENEQQQIEQLTTEFPVWMSDISNLSQALEMIGLLGELLGKKSEADLLLNDIGSGFARLAKDKNSESKRVLYLIWKNPYMVAGTGTFIDSILQCSGFTNAAKMERYPVLNADEISDISPDVIFLSSEPYPFREKHLLEFNRICPQARVEIVDGEMFSWYGSRLLEVPAYLQTLLR